jgi:hypothetical protein
MRRGFWIALGVVVVVGLAAGLLLPAICATRESSYHPRCRTNLKLIGYGVHLYADDHDGRFPPSLQELVPEYLPLNRRRPEFHPLGCPSTPDPGRPGYEYVEGLRPGDPAGLVVAYDREGNHEEGRRVLFVAGNVEWFGKQREDEFQAALAKTREHVKQRDAAKHRGDAAQ